MVDQDLLTELQYALLEPPDGGQSWPSEVWSRDEVMTQLNHGCDHVSRETQAVLSEIEQFVIAGALSVSVPGDWLMTASLAWRTFPQDVRSPLIPLDAFEADAARPGWEVNRATPIGYCDLDTNTLELRLVPTPDITGVLEHVYVPAPPTITGNGMDLPFPDELLTAVKYMALHLLLRSLTRLQDVERAAYCEQRTQIQVEAITILLSGGA